jgi:hypothetical protein
MNPIEKHNLNDMVMDFYFEQGRSARETALGLQERGYDVKEQDVVNYIRTTKGNLSEVERRELSKQLMNVVSEMFERIGKLKKKSNEYEDDPDAIKIWLYIDGELRKAFELYAKLTGQLIHSPIIQKNTINITQINQQIEKKIVELVDTGEIALKSDRMKYIYEQAKG